jgi:hypothetical protein
MWTTLALMSALNWTPAQAGQMELKNVRDTYGILGQERKESTYLPGDLVVLAFDIEGLKVTDDGQVRYSMSMELTDSKGKSLFKKDPDPQGTLAVNTLGKSRLPAFALTEVGTDTAPGKYTMTVVVTDVSAKDKKDRPTVELKRDFEVKPSRFGIVRPGFTNVSLKEPQPAPPLGVPGQSLFFNFAVVGFDLKGDKMEPNVKVKMEVLDETGKAVNEKPFTGEAKQIDEEAKKLRVIPFQLPMQLNRSGKFKVVVTATDEHTGKTATQTLDLKVVEVN